MPSHSLRPASPSPFAGWPEGVTFGRAGDVAWFLANATLCVRFASTRVDLPLARAYVEMLRAVRELESETLAARGGLSLYQDFSAIRVIERDARAYLVDVTRSEFTGLQLRGNAIELAARSPMARATVQLVARVAAQSGFPPFRLAVDLAREMANDGTRAPRDDAAHVARHARLAQVLDFPRRGGSE